MFRREASLRSRIRQLVNHTLRDLPPEGSRRAAEAVWSYDKRGTLVHDGDLPEEVLSKASEIARVTLIDVLRRKAAIDVALPAA